GHRRLGSASAARHGIERRTGFFVRRAGGLIRPAAQAAGRSLRPAGTTPVVTMRHSATSSLRANAPIMVDLRTPLAATPARYHFTRAQPLLNTRKRPRAP